MRISRICLQQDLCDNAVINLTGDYFNYLARVLRLKAGAKLIIFNGLGGEYPAELISIDKRNATIQLSAIKHHEVESPLDITLVQGISRGDRMDTTLQKATELGVSNIIPVFTQRSTVSLKAERLDKKLSHWQGVIRSACEQCGRNQLPNLHTPQPIADYLQDNKPTLGIVLAPDVGNDFGTLTKPTAEIHLLIGPEGGLSQREYETCYQHGFRGIEIGPRVLRTETAALAAISAMQTLWGDFTKSM